MSGHFEAKKIAWRQTKDGLVLALAIHPDDVSPEMALAALNTRFMIAYSEIGDDEKPITQAPQAERSEGGPSKPFSTLPLSQQAAIRCGDHRFQEFMGEKSADATAAEVRRACRVGSRAELDDSTNEQNRWIWEKLDEDFQAWLVTQRYAGSKR